MTSSTTGLCLSVKVLCLRDFHWWHFFCVSLQKEEGESHCSCLTGKEKLWQACVGWSQSVMTKSQVYGHSPALQLRNVKSLEMWRVKSTWRIHFCCPLEYIHKIIKNTLLEVRLYNREKKQFVVGVGIPCPGLSLEHQLFSETGFLYGWISDLNQRGSSRAVKPETYGTGDRTWRSGFQKPAFLYEQRQKKRAGEGKKKQQVFFFF